MVFVLLAQVIMFITIGSEVTEAIVGIQTITGEILGALQDKWVD